MGFAVPACRRLQELLIRSDRSRVAEKPDLTLGEVVADWPARDTPTSCGAAWRFFKHEGSHSKNVWPAPSAKGLCEVI